MNRSKNTTDQAFRESLKQYQETPPAGVWDGISGELDLNSRRSRIIWIRRIAASIAFILAVGSVWLLIQRPPESDITDTGKRQEAAVPGKSGPEYNESTTESTGQPETNHGNAVFPAINSGGRNPISPDPAIRNLSEQVQNNAGLQNQKSFEGALSSSDIHNESVDVIVPKYIYHIGKQETETGTLLAVHTPQPEPMNTETGIDVFDEFGEEGYSAYDKWALGGQITPLFSYRALENSADASGGSAYLNEIESGIVSYAAGMNLNYFPAKRLSLQSGLYYSRMGMTVGNTYLASGDIPSYRTDISSTQLALANSSGQIQLGAEKSNSQISNLSASAEYLMDNNTVINPGTVPAVSTGEILQHFEYLEIPLILRYRLIDRRLGFNLLGGLSTNFLVGSDAYFIEGNSQEYIGTTQELKPVNYSSVLGVGLQYSISKSFWFNLEPTFRYYLNSVNPGSGIGSHPYSLGFFTGISYLF